MRDTGLTASVSSPTHLQNKGAWKGRSMTERQRKHSRDGIFEMRHFQKLVVIIWKLSHTLISLCLKYFPHKRQSELKGKKRWGAGRIRRLTRKGGRGEHQKKQQTGSHPNDTNKKRTRQHTKINRHHKWLRQLLGGAVFPAPPLPCGLSKRPWEGGGR